MSAISSRVAYFAYGSNLSIEGMADRTLDSSELVCKAVLPDYKLTFRGVADIVPAPQRNVQGGLWFLTIRGVEAIDLYEGVPTLYEQIFITVETEYGPIDAMSYRMTAPTYQTSPPGDYYLQIIRDGYLDWGLDTAELSRALSDVTQDRMERSLPAKPLKPARSYSYKRYTPPARNRAAGTRQFSSASGNGHSQRPQKILKRANSKQASEGRRCPRHDQCQHPKRLRVLRDGRCAACGTQITARGVGHSPGTHRTDYDYYGSHFVE